MVNRQYYSARTGKNTDAIRLDLPTVRRLFRDIFLTFTSNDYFQEAFGYHCEDAGEVPGRLGTDMEAQMIKTLGKSNLWPIPNKCLSYSEDDLFDVIELLHDWISKPIKGYYHTWNDCGWHYEEFDKQAGQKEFRDKINEILCDYQDGYELSDKGEILEQAEAGLDLLFEADLPTYDPENVEKRVEAAISKFRSYRSSLNDKHYAILELIAVLEFIRPKVKQIIQEDEADLFNIANRFGLRHHNNNQKTDYDKEIWYPWMFCYYLATIHGCLRLIKKADTKNNNHSNSDF
jgi:hypothetical protein